MKKFQIRAQNNKYVKLGAPLKVYYDITSDCNLNCIFCFKGKNKKKVTWDTIKDVITKIADANIPDVVFIGGEPMCSPFLFDAFLYCKELGINTGIVTNGTLFNKDNVKKLKKFVNNSISISIHAPNDILHDELSRGENVYSSIIKGLELLNEYDIIPELSFTPVKANIYTLYDTISSVLDKGIRISDVLVNRLIPSGNALERWCDKEITLNEQVILLDQMERLSKEYPNLKIATGDALPFCMVEEK